MPVVPGRQQRRGCIHGGESRPAPLRMLMRAHWERAVKTLDDPIASPYAVSYFTLPRHWELANIVRTSALGENALPGGNFEAARPATNRGAVVSTLRGWTVQEVAIDDVDMTAESCRRRPRRMSSRKSRTSQSTSFINRPPWKNAYSNRNRGGQISAKAFCS